jgi:hypothetical protein
LIHIEAQEAKSVKQVVAERLDAKTGDIVAARTVRGSSAECLLVGNEIAIGVVSILTDDTVVTIRVSTDPNDYDQARVYDDDELVQSLLLKEGAVVYIDEAAKAAVDAVSSQPAEARAK